MDASQKCAYDLTARPTEVEQSTQPDHDLPPAPITAEQVSNHELHEAATQVDAVDDNGTNDTALGLMNPNPELEMTDTQRMISQSSKDWQVEGLPETLQDPYEDVQLPESMSGDGDRATPEGGHTITDSNAAQSGEGVMNGTVIQSGSLEGVPITSTDSAKAQSGEGGHDSKGAPGHRDAGLQQGAYDRLRKLAREDVEDNNQDQHSDDGSVELLNDDNLLEAELARVMLKDRHQT